MDGTRKETNSASTANKVRASSPFCPAAITAEFQERSENTQALLRLKGDFSAV